MTLTRTPFPSSPSKTAAGRGLVALAVLLWLAFGAGARLLAAPEHAPAANATEAPAAAQPPAHATEPPAAVEGRGGEGAEHGEGEATESAWAWVARLFNFAILAGGLFYLLRSPLRSFLEQRGVAVRSELTTAAGLKKEAAAQLEQIDAKMRALPGEIEALKRRGAEEIAAEEARIHALAESERRRLLDQARREITTQLRIAERDLKKRAGELAIEVATERVKRTITDRDHARLVDRYVSQVRH